MISVFSKIANAAQPSGFQQAPGEFRRIGQGDRCRSRKTGQIRRRLDVTLACIVRP